MSTIYEGAKDLQFQSRPKAALKKGKDGYITSHWYLCVKSLGATFLFPTVLSNSAIVLRFFAKVQWNQIQMNLLQAIKTGMHSSNFSFYSLESSFILKELKPLYEQSAPQAVPT
ncbi:uncharacterized protein LOC132645007 isoform X3 [Lycium barbarum]|uniref:uncharacterized protein LOC132645007 isoform X3 n=1 Tax=Lycium barbarum TaxID=112863 RepID=UPI00293EA34F|nr:uncharacterized protein LOC132645007 isoform X3 [Lycium barbarum]